MKSTGNGLHYRRRQGRAGCDGAGRGIFGGAVGGSKDDTSLVVRTAVRATIAAGAYVAQDVRDRDGLTRPMLRRAALRLAFSRQEPLRRLGTAYLRSDPPAAEELPALRRGALPAGVRLTTSAADAAAPIIDVDPATVVELGGGAAD